MGKFRQSLFGLAAIAGLSTILGGCYGRGTDDANNFAVVDPNAPATFATVNAEIFTPICSKCHTSWFGSQNTLLSHKGLISPGQPNDSLILQMVESGAMPQGGPHLSDSQIDLIRRYVESLSNTPDPAPTPAPSASPSPTPSATPNPQATYAWLKANLFDVSCNSCHDAAHARPPHKPELDTYDALKAAASDAYNEIDTGDMPPDDSVPAVTPEAKAALMQWIQAGYPQ